MNEKEVLKNLMANSNFRKAFRDLMLEDVYLAEELGVGANNEALVYVWCVELENQNDEKKYYHPAIVPSSEYAMSLDSMMEVGSYQMLYSEDQFKVHEYDPMIDMMKSCVSYPIRMIVMPKSTYEKLETALTELVGSILNEVEKCFEHFDNIARMTHQNTDRMKMQFIFSIFNNITVVATCINQDMEIVSSENHDYSKPIDDTYDEYDEDEYYDEYYEMDHGELNEPQKQLYRLFFRTEVCEDECSGRIEYAWLDQEQIRVLTGISRSACCIEMTNGEKTHSMYIHHVEKVQNGESDELPFE